MMIINDSILLVCLRIRNLLVGSMALSLSANRQAFCHLATKAKEPSDYVSSNTWYGCGRINAKNHCASGASLNLLHVCNVYARRSHQ